MRVAIDNRKRNALVVCWAILVPAACLLISSAQFVAVCLGSSRADPRNWIAAANLDPTDAEYLDMRGNYASLAGNGDDAIKTLQSATKLNPYRSNYWLDLARVERISGNVPASENALARAVADDPKSPSVAWEAANVYWSLNKDDDALKEFSAVLQGRGEQADAALSDCWKIRPNARLLLNEVIPQNTDSVSGFLEFLIARKDSQAAADAWSELVTLRQGVEKRFVFDYVRYLLDQKDVAQASRVWEQAASLSGLAGYQRSADNLLVNANFKAPVLNNGFDWRSEPVSGASLTLDPSQSDAGSRSLQIDFDSSSMGDVGIGQVIPVNSNSDYNFSASYRTKDLEAAGAPRFTIEDAYTNQRFFLSDELKAATQWKTVRSTFHTMEGTKLLQLRIQVLPSNYAIRGKLWVNGLRLAQLSSAEPKR